jgi:protease-4
MKLVGSYTIAESLKQSRENPRVGAVVLRIDSGGGSALSADVLWREVELTSRVKPVIVSMGSAAASAAYYMAAPATRIFANPLTITGSIGVFVGKADVAELLRRIGVTVEAYKTTPRADAEALYRPFTAEERAELERKVKKFYDQFLSRVVQGRARAGVKLTTAELDKVAQGRVWTGQQAFERKLVDEIGGLRQALDAARRLAKLPEHAPVVELPVPESSLLGRMLGIEGMRAESDIPSMLPSELLDMARALAPFAVHPADKLLARIEIVSVGP